MPTGREEGWGPKFIPFQAIVRGNNNADTCFGMAALTIDLGNNSIPARVTRNGSWGFPSEPICQVALVKPLPETRRYLVCLGTFMLLLDITIVNVALPDIQRALNSSFSDLQWIVDAYALTLAAFLLTAGSLADMFGRRLLYLVGLAVSPSRRYCAALPSAR